MGRGEFRRRRGGAARQGFRSCAKHALSHGRLRHPANFTKVPVPLSGARLKLDFE